MKDVLENKSFELAKIHTDKNLSLMMIKVVTKDMFSFPNMEWVCGSFPWVGEVCWCFPPCSRA